MSHRKLLIYSICSFFALLTIFAGYAGEASAGLFADTGLTPPANIAIDPTEGAGSTERQEEESQSPPPGEIRLVVNIDMRTLTVLEGEEALGVYPVAIGKWSTPTPIGEWKIINMGAHWGGPFGARWLGLDIPWGVYGIHGTNNPGSISSAASQGCMRMFNEDIVQFFHLVREGTRVDIAGSPHDTNYWHRNLGDGSEGPDVVFVQLALKKKGFYPYYCDGQLGRLSVQGIRQFQVVAGLPDTGIVDEKTNQRLHEEPPAEEPVKEPAEEDKTPGDGQAN
jgi:hypothetical protein